VYRAGRLSADKRPLADHQWADYYEVHLKQDFRVETGLWGNVFGLKLVFEEVYDIYSHLIKINT
jgi:hypothetical protein